MVSGGTTDGDAGMAVLCRDSMRWSMRNLLMYRILPGFAAALIALMLASAPSHSAPAPLATRHMIVAAEPDAAAAGLEMLRQGGSAVDAAIAAQMVLTLEEPQASGIGGGAYLIVSGDGARVCRSGPGNGTWPARCPRCG